MVDRRITDLPVATTPAVGDYAVIDGTTTRKILVSNLVPPATGGAATLRGNPSAVSAPVTDFTVQGLPARGTPDQINDVIPIFDAAAGRLKKVSPDQLIAVASVGRTFVNVKESYGVVGGNDPGDSAKIQTAFNNAPQGCVLVIPTDLYTTSTGWTMNKYMDVWMQNSNVLGTFTGTTGDVLRVSLTASVPGQADNRQMVIRGGRLTCSGGGNCAINVNPLGNNTEGPSFGLMITEGLHTGNLRAIRIGGTGAAGDTNFCTIDNNQLATNIPGAAAVDLDGCADGHRITKNLVFGLGTAIRLNLVAGAFNTYIANNGLVAREGALVIVNGSRVDFMYNQCEQTAAYGTNTSGAQVIVQGFGRIAADNRFIGNNFGGGTNVNYGILLYNARGTIIDENQFYPPNTADVFFADGSGGLVANYNFLGPKNWARGTRTERFGALTDATRRLIVKEDLNCKGNHGVWKPFPATQNGWTTTNAEYFVDRNQIIHFEGFLTSGTTTPGTVITTFPLGTRPNVGKNLAFPRTDSFSSTGLCFLAPSGSLTVGNATGSIDMSTTSYQVKVMDSYDPGP